MKAKARGNFLIERRTPSGRLIKKHWLKNAITDAGVKQFTDRLIRTAAPNWNSLTLALWGSDISTGSAIVSNSATVSATGVFTWSMELSSSSTYSGIGNLVVKNGTVTIASAARSAGSLPASKPANEIWTISWTLSMSGGSNSARQQFLKIVTNRISTALTPVIDIMFEDDEGRDEDINLSVGKSNTVARTATSTEDSVTMSFPLNAPSSVNRGSNPRLSSIDANMVAMDGSSVELYRRASTLRIAAAGTYKVKWSFS